MVGFQLNINHLCWWIIVSSVHHCVFKVSPSSTTRGGGLLGSNGGEDSLITTDKMLICNYYSHRITAGILSNPHIVSSLHMDSILGHWDIQDRLHDTNPPLGISCPTVTRAALLWLHHTTPHHVSKWKLIIFGKKYTTKLILHLITQCPSSVHISKFSKINDSKICTDVNKITLKESFITEGPEVILLVNLTWRLLPDLQYSSPLQ